VSGLRGGGRRVATRLAAATFVALALVGVAAAPASAHAVLESTTPSASSQVARSPRSITLRFGEAVEASLGAIRLYNSSGNRVDVGSPQHPGGKGSEVSSSAPSLDDGSYVVTWRVISADSHPVRGAFTFTVGNGAASTKVESLASRLLTQQGGDATVGATYAVARFGIFTGIILLVGASAFLLLVWPEGRVSARAARLVWGGWIVAMVSTLAAFALQGAYAAALPLPDAFKPSLWGDILDTRYGHVAAFRVVLLLVALPLIRTILVRPGRPLAEHPLPGWLAPGAGLVGVGLVVTPGLAGHASTGSQVPLALLADAVHVGAVSLWVGALPVLAYALLPTADVGELRRAIPRYSQLALFSVIAIMISGSYQSWREVGSFGALTSTDFGRILLVKLGLFAVLIIVAAFSRDIVNQQYRYLDDDPAPGADPDPDRELVSVGADRGPASPAVGAGPDDPDDPDDPDFAFERQPLDDETAARKLRHGVWLEVAIAVLVLSVTALLVNAAPAREANSGPWIGYIKTPTLWYDTNVVPAKVGPNDIHLTAITPGGAPKDVLEMSAEFSEDGRGVAPINVPLRRLAPGHYFSPGFQIPFAGTWKLTIRALVDQTDEVVGSAEIPIR
jgi:copper transport protein